MAYRVVYGETMPSWEQTFPTLRAAMAFARRQHENFGDVIYSIKLAIPGEAPQSLQAWVEVAHSTDPEDLAKLVAGAKSEQQR